MHTVEAIAPTYDGRHTIPSPEVTDVMLELLQLTPEDKLLEIGTGSTYQTRRWAETGCTVHSIELQPFVDPTKGAFGGCSVYLHAGDGLNGIPSAAPFTAIVATCGVSEVPKAWANQLSEGGRLVVPLGEVDCQRLVLYKKENGQLIPQKIAAYVRFSMLEGHNGNSHQSSQ